MNFKILFQFAADLEIIENQLKIIMKNIVIFLRLN